MARRRKAELPELDEPDGPAELTAGDVAVDSVASVPETTAAAADESSECLEPDAGDDAADVLGNESPESPQESPQESPEESPAESPEGPPPATPFARPAYDPADWLARIQAQNQVVIDAATELESAKVVARNRKKSYDAAAELLSDLIKQQKAEQDEWNRPLPLFDGNANGQANGFAAPAHSPANVAVYPTENGSIPDDQLGDAWRFASIAELELPGKLAQKLEDDAGVRTIGQLEDLRGGAGLNSIKGIGPGKITIIEDAVINWLSVQRDAKALSVASASVSVNGDDILSGGGVATGETLDVAAVDVGTGDDFDDLDI